MSTITCQISVSLDGYAAGPDQSTDDPLGRGGERLHEWMFADAMAPADQAIREAYGKGVGAVRHGPQHVRPRPRRAGPDWRGWWGEDPPYHVPVFVLTHHERPALEMEGGTTFHFVTGGIEAALAQARGPRRGTTSRSPAARRP